MIHFISVYVFDCIPDLEKAQVSETLVTHSESKFVSFYCSIHCGIVARGFVRRIRGNTKN